jgi:hypothetical protein
LLFNSTDFSLKAADDDDNFSFGQVTYRKQRKRNKGKKRKNRKRKKENIHGNVIQKENNRHKTPRRKNKRCKKCFKRKKMRTKFRKHMYKLDPTTIRQIIERVAEEALQKGAGSMDFGVNYNPFTMTKGKYLLLSLIVVSQIYIAN